MPSQPSHSFSFYRHWVLWVAFCIMVGNTNFAEDIILHLRSGDRITGRLVSENTNSVVLATAFSDSVSIPRSLIERREAAPKPSGSSTNQPASAPSKPPPAPATGVVSELAPTNKPTKPQPATAAAKPPAASVVQTNPPPPSLWTKFFSEWRGEAQMGANLGFGTKDREAFTGRARLTHNHPLPSTRTLRNILTYDVAYGTTDGELSDNRMAGDLKTELDLTKRFLLYNAAAVGYDEIRGVDLEYDFGPGLGYKWVVLTNFVFRTELGGDYQRQYFIHDRTTSRYSLRLAEDIWWQLTPSLRWDEKVEFYPEVKEFARYRVRLESNLSYLLRQNLTLTLNVVDLYDTAVPAGLSKNDLQIRSLLGIKF